MEQEGPVEEAGCAEPAKDPEAAIAAWFTEARLERFAASLERAPGLWPAAQAPQDNTLSRAGEYMRLLDSLGESAAGGARARLACAAALCRVFYRLLRKQLLCALDASAAGGGGPELAGALCPAWARRAERYLHTMPQAFPCQKEESRPAKPKKPAAKKSKAKAEKTAAKSPSTTPHAGNTGAKAKKPVPALLPLASRSDVLATPKPVRLLMRRVACGMRRAAQCCGGPLSAAVADVASDLKLSIDVVNPLWCGMRRLALAKFRALIARGDAPSPKVSSRLFHLDWGVVDLLVSYECPMVGEASYQSYKQLLALLGTFHLVQRFDLEPSPGEEVPPQKWFEAARWYCRTGVQMSAVGLQRRWHELKLHTQRLRRDVTPHRDVMPLSVPLHQAIAARYPHVMTGPLVPWSQLVKDGKVAAPTNERGFLAAREKRWVAEHSPGNDTEKHTGVADDDYMDSMETISSGGETVTDGATPDRSTQQSSKVVMVIDDLPERASNSIDPNNDDGKSNNDLTNKALDVNKEVIDLDPPSPELNVLKGLQGIELSNVIKVIESIEDMNNEITDDPNVCQTPNNLSETGGHINDGKTINKSYVQNSNAATNARSMIEAIEREIFSNRDQPTTSKRNKSVGIQNYINTIKSNDKTQISATESRLDTIDKVTTASGNNDTNECDNITVNKTNKYPNLTRILESKCIFDDSELLFAGSVAKNNQLNSNDESPTIDLTKDADIGVNKKKSALVGRKIIRRHQSSDAITSAWVEQIVRDITKQRQENTRLENSQIQFLFNVLHSRTRPNVNKRCEFDNSVSSESGKKKRRVSRVLEDTSSVVDDDDAVYISSDDDQEGGGESRFDPKLLMYPVVLLARIEEDPSLRILPPPYPTNRQPSFSNLSPKSPISFPNSTSNSLFHTNKELLKLCKPCAVVLVRLEFGGVDRGEGNRWTKRVELRSIEEVRRNNRGMLTAQVAPIAQRRDSTSSLETLSCDSDWLPDEEVSLGPIEKARKTKHSDDDLGQLLKDFVGSPGDEGCCLHNRSVNVDGNSTASPGCSCCVWRVLAAPPSSARLAGQQRQLLRLVARRAGSEATTSTTAVNRKEKPKRSNKRRRTSSPCPDDSARHEGWDQGSIQPAPTLPPLVPLPTAEANPKTSDRSTPKTIKVIKLTWHTLRDPSGRFARARTNRLNDPTRRSKSKRLKPKKNVKSAEALPEKNVMPAEIFNPTAVADINRKLVMLIDSRPPTPTEPFDPIITNVLSLAPLQETDLSRNSVIKRQSIPPTEPPKGAPDVTIRSGEHYASHMDIPERQQSIPIQTPEATKKPVPNISVIRDQFAYTWHTDGPKRYKSMPTRPTEPTKELLAPNINFKRHEPGYACDMDRPERHQNIPMQPTLKSIQNPSAPNFNVRRDEPTHAYHMDRHEAHQSVLTQPSPQSTKESRVPNISVQRDPPTYAWHIDNHGKHQSIPTLPISEPTKEFPVPNIPDLRDEPTYAWHIDRHREHQRIPTLPISEPQKELCPNVIIKQDQASLHIKANIETPNHVFPSHTMSQPFEIEVPIMNPPQNCQENKSQFERHGLLQSTSDPQNLMPNSFIQPQNHGAQHWHLPSHSQMQPRTQNMVTQHWQTFQQMTPQQFPQQSSTYEHTQSENMSSSECMQANMVAENYTQAFQDSAWGNQRHFNHQSAFQPYQADSVTNPYLAPMARSQPEPFGFNMGFSQPNRQLESCMLAGTSHTFDSISTSQPNRFYNPMQGSDPFPMLGHEGRASYTDFTGHADVGLPKAIWQDTSVPGSHMQAPLQAVEFEVKVDRETPLAAVPSAEGNLDVDENHSLCLDVPGSPLPSSEWIVGRDPASLLVLCFDGGARGWVAGGCLVLSAQARPPPRATVWAPRPRRRLQLPHTSPPLNAGRKTSPDVTAAPDPAAPPAAKLKVKSFARMDEPDSHEEGAPARICHDDEYYQKLSDHPLTYAKLLAAVGSARACRGLLERGAQLQLYCLRTSNLYPLHAERSAGPKPQWRLSGAEEVFPAVKAICAQLQWLPDAGLLS